MTNEVDIEQYIIKADYYIKNLLFSLVPLYRKEHGEEQDVVVPLFTSLHSTSESILILLLNHGIYDADILLRTVMEGTVKYCYLMTGTKKERNEKYLEYKIKLPEISRIFDHRKAVEAVEILQEFSDNNTKPFECDILSNDELSRLMTLYPKKLQLAIKKKWSYQSLIRSLAENYSEYKAQLGTLSTYALTSHLCHYDWTGVSSRLCQMMESTNPSSKIYDILHTIRIISNVLSMELFRVAEYLRGNNFNSKSVSELSIEILSFITKLDNYSNKMLAENI